MKPYNKSLGHTFHFHKHIIENEYNQVLLWYFSIPSDFAKKQLFIHFSCTQKCCGWIKAGFSADEIHLHLWWERISCKHKSTPAASSSKSCFWKDYHLPFSEPFSHPEGDGSCLLFWTLLSLHKFCIIRKSAFWIHILIRQEEDTIQNWMF